jgi:hypothetical protein
VRNARVPALYDDSSQISTGSPQRACGQRHRSKHLHCFVSLRQGSPLCTQGRGGTHAGQATSKMSSRTPSERSRAARCRAMHAAGPRAVIQSRFELNRFERIEGRSPLSRRPIWQLSSWTGPCSGVSGACAAGGGRWPLLTTTRQLSRASRSANTDEPQMGLALASSTSVGGACGGSVQHTRSAAETNKFACGT